MKHCYVPHKFRPVSLEFIDAAKRYMSAFEAAGYVPTLRGLYYKMVVGGDLVNSKDSYKRLSERMSEARMAGLVDWDALADHMRPLESWPVHESPRACIEAAVRNYGVDLWEGQECRVEVWTEKDTMLPIMERACAPWRVPHLATRGRMSTTGIYEAAQRAAVHAERGRHTWIIYVGDHDPAGVSMTEDIPRRLRQMWPAGACPVSLCVAALTLAQVDECGLPPNLINPKKKDRLLKAYAARFGTRDSWEVDALPIDVLVAAVQTKIRALLCEEEFAVAECRERDARRRLEAALAPVEL